MNKISAYGDKARQLICSKEARETADLVKVDYLCFSLPLANMRHCYGARSITPAYVYKDKTCYKSTTVFPRQPVIEAYQPVGLAHDEYIAAIERHKMKSHEKLTEFYEKTLSVFVDFILGFRLSTPRDKGFHGYQNSLSILTQDGIEVGFVGIGGQRDTIYIQLSGLACKHLFEYTNLKELHHWLNAVLGVDKLSRIDLARDDFDGNFDCAYAKTAYDDDAFRTGAGGVMPEECNPSRSRRGADGKPIYSVEMFTVGIRSSPVYWRVYNKKLEQGIVNEDLTWYRSEVELKKWSVDVLLDLDAAFAGVCEFAQSMTNSVGIRTKSMNKAKAACLDLASRVKWIRHAAGKALGDILEIIDGDIEHAIGLILPDDSGGKLGIPPTYHKLINHALEA